MVPWHFYLFFYISVFSLVNQKVLELTLLFPWSAWWQMTSLFGKRGQHEGTAPPQLGSSPPLFFNHVCSYLLHGPQICLLCRFSTQIFLRGDMFYDKLSFAFSNPINPIYSHHHFLTMFILGCWGLNFGKRAKLSSSSLSSSPPDLEIILFDCFVFFK